MIQISSLVAHPRNPRFAPRQDIVEQIAVQLRASGVFDPVHALVVRAVATNGTYEIVSGHHRKLAAEQAGIPEVPCWVRAMSDDEAYLRLVSDNAQGELSPLEVGMHALHSGLSGAEYARQVGMAQATMAFRIMAARVADAVVISHEITTLCDRWRHLAEIHAAPPWLWSALAARLLRDGWTVEDTRRQVKIVHDLHEPPDWANSEAIAAAVADGAMKPSEVGALERTVAESRQRLAPGIDGERLLGVLGERLQNECPSRLSEVKAICFAVETEQADLARKKQQEDLAQAQRAEEVAARTARMRQNISLEEWNTLAPDEQQALLTLSPDDTSVGKFNQQKTDFIEWAQFSWNPVVGCLHSCIYCYARDIAQSADMAKFYPYGFAPALRPASLLVPGRMKIPKQAQTDTRFRNVFTCSMADLFGRWVPDAWIEAVLAAIREAPEWNFLCLTKFPKRLTEFQMSPNAWMGTTVDLQARVKAAEDAFEYVQAGVKWLSVEPMLEPLRFQHLDRFDWLVIGGASPSKETPEWRPPFSWIYSLLKQAEDAGCKVYFKTNLLGKRRLELPFDAPIKTEEDGPPSVFKYLGV